MGHTIIEKIIGKNIGREVKPGDIVTVNVDRVMIHDIFIPFVKEKFEEMGLLRYGTQTRQFLYMTILCQQVRLMIQDISVLVMNLWKNTE